MAELGFHRSAKKCKEKFENVYKYHKRTKDGRSSKSDGKTYRFFDQLEALDQLQPFQIVPPVQQQPVCQSKGMSFQLAPPVGLLQTPTTISFGQQPCNPNTITHVAKNPTKTLSPKFQTGMTNFMVSTSSSTSSDDFQPQRRSGKKRKWKDFFEKLMRDVVDKQEELQTKFLKTLEMRERERNMREEAWRMQEMARLNHEHEVLVHERSAAAAKDAAVIAFLQKIAGQPASVVIPTQTHPAPQPQPQPKPQPPPHPIQQIIISPTPPKPKQVNVMKQDHNNDQNKMLVCSNITTSPSPSRWPKTEVEALIKLRTSFEIKYQENGPKGPFWEEISAGMRTLGYNRNAKRCKEKWENINKYFKKVKESNKQRPEDSKTCPYYHLLDAIYKEKKGGFNGGDFNYPQPSNANSLMEPLMVQPEQQWPLAPDQTLASNIIHSQNPNNEDEQDDMLDEDELDQDMEDDQEDDIDERDNNGSDTYEVVMATTNNKPQHESASSATTTGNSIETAVA